MSPGGVSVMAPVFGRVGERVVAYLEQLGRIEGTIVRSNDSGFAMAINATPRKRDKFAAQRTWLANRHILDPAQSRAHERIIPLRPQTTMVLADGPNRARPCRAASGRRSMRWFGSAEPKVAVRMIDAGFAVKFTSLQHPDSFERDITGA